MNLKTIRDKIPTLTTKQKVTAWIMAGVIVGLACLFAYLLRFHTYLGHDSAACVNCHIMSPYYATWSHSSHARDAECNDCHVPNDNFAHKYLFKGMDGMKHVAYFVKHSEREAIMAEDGSAEVIMDNCIRCHTQLNQEFVKTGRKGYMETKKEQGFVCWDCHRNVPHGGMNSQSATPGAESQVPLPESPSPKWLDKMMGCENEK